MRALWAILLGGLTLLGTAEARLGETRDEIEKKVGKLDEADFKYPQIRLLRLSNKEGFSQIDYLFFKQDIPQTAKCVGVIYFKIYEDKSDKITIQEAKKIIQENLPAFPEGFRVGSFKNINDEGWELFPTNDLWEIYWSTPADIPNGGSSASVVNLDSPRSIVISCVSGRYVWFTLEKDPGSFVKLPNTADQPMPLISPSQIIEKNK